MKKTYKLKKKYDYNIGDRVICIVDIYDKNINLNRTETYSLIKNKIYTISYVSDIFIKLKDIDDCKLLNKNNFLKINDYRKLKIENLLCN